MPASNTRIAGGRGWICASSRPTRRAMTSFSPHVLTNSRYFWRLSKKRKLRERAPASTLPLSTTRGSPVAGAAARMRSFSSGGAFGALAPNCPMNALIRASVSGVMRAPSRKRATNFPSLTARRPKVDSAMLLLRQNCAMQSSSAPPVAVAGLSMCGLPFRGRQPYPRRKWDYNHFRARQSRGMLPTNWSFQRARRVATGATAVAAPAPPTQSHRARQAFEDQCGTSAFSRFDLATALSNTKPPPRTSTRMVSLGPNSPARIFFDKAFSIEDWIARFSGRAP